MQQQIPPGYKLSKKGELKPDKKAKKHGSPGLAHGGPGVAMVNLHLILSFTLFRDILTLKECQANIPKECLLKECILNQE